MEGLIRFFIARPLLVHLMVVAVILGGVAIASQSQREGFPNITLNMMVVTAVLPGAAASDIETMVTLPIEEAIGELDGVETFTSTIQDNISFTYIELDGDYGRSAIRQAEREARQAIDAITDFPEQMTERPILTVLQAGRFPMAEVVIEGSTTSLPQAARRLQTALRQVDGVSSVTIVGLEDPEIRVLIEPDRARAHGVALVDVITALRRRDVASTGGVLEAPDARRQVVLEGRLRTTEDVANTVLLFLPTGGQIRVGDVARVERGREERGLRVHTNGQPGLSLVVRKQESADLLSTMDRVQETVASFELPEGVRCTVVNDASFLARNRLKLVFSNGLMGIALVVVLVFLFLSRRAALWVTMGIPTVLAMVLICMEPLGMTINMISMAGFVVVLGMLVDDAVVVAERIELRRIKGLPGSEAALRGSLDVVLPVCAAAITTVIAFLPMLELGGLPGKLVWYIPAVVVLAMSFSVFESILILPCHMAGHGETERTSAPPERLEKRSFVRRLEKHYRRILGPIIRFRYLTLLLFFGLIVLILGLLMPRMAFILFPQDDVDALYLKVTVEPGTSIEETEAVVTSLERQIPQIVGGDLLAVTARIGHQVAVAIDRQQGSADHEAVISILFHPEHSMRTRTVAEWSAILSQQLRVPHDVEVVHEPRRLGPPVGRPVTIHVSSNNDEARRSTAAALADRLKAIDGLVDIEIDERPGLQQLTLSLDHERLAMRGLDAEAVGLTLNAALYGVRVSERRDMEETTGLRVMLDPSARRSLEAVLDSPLRNRQGTIVPLRDVVQPIEAASVARLYHRNGVRTATVSAGFAAHSGHTASSFGRFLRHELIPAADSSEVNLSIGGEAVQTQEVMGNLTMVATLAVLGVFFVVWLFLGSFIDALFVLLAVPFGVVGIIIAVAAHGAPLSIFVSLAMVGLAGVVVNDSILMVDAIKRRLVEVENESAETRREAMLEAVVERLRPVLVTSVTTMGGVLPMGYGLGGYDAMLSPMSLALGWGLAFTTMIILILIPTLFSIAGDIRSLGARLRRKNSIPEAERESGATV